MLMYAMDYFSTLQKEENLPAETTYLNLDDIMLNQVSHTQKENSTCLYV